MTVRALRGAGYRVLVASGGAAALEVAAAEPAPIHLVLTDVVMPGLDGHAVAERLAAARAEVRVLYMSGYAESVVARRGVLAPGVELLAKPFTPAALLGRVRAVLDA
jgi:DNA-binding response OmpR family regulator